VGRDGSVFKTRASGDPGGLPRLTGPRDQLGTMVKRLGILQEQLGKHRVSRVRVNPRGAWSVRVDDRVELRFGRRHWKERLARFLQVERKWSLLERAVSRIDLRYPDGMAVATAPEGAPGNRKTTEHPTNQG